MHTVAGGGSCAPTIPSGQLNVPPTFNSACEGIKATSVSINRPTSVAALPDGSYLYVDSGNDLIQQVSAAGVVTTVAGNGTTTDAPDGTLATASGLNDPVAVAPLPNGGFLVTESAGSVVRMVSPGGPTTATISTIAGTGMPGSSPSSGLATSTPLNWPTEAEVTPGGQVLIADSYNNEIRSVSYAGPGATMTTVAGGGSCDDVAGSCDGQQATAVALHHPVSVSPLANGGGGFLIAEAGVDANVIREVSPSGTFSTVAGAPGPAGFGGDGGPATAAQLDQPNQVVSTPDGGFLIADSNNEVIRQVSPDGTISTVAGDGTASYSGDGGDATAADLDEPAWVSPRAAGGLLIADSYNNVIRAVTLAPVTTITAIPNGSNGWFDGAGATVTVTASGAKSTRCVLDPSAAPPVYDAIPSGCPYMGKSPALITGDGTHTLWAASINSFGDEEEPISVTFKLDMTPPALVCTKVPTFTLGQRHAKLTATLSDALSGPAYPTASAFANTGFIGSYANTVFGADLAGNIGEVGCTYNVVPAILRPAPRLQWSASPGAAGTTIRRLVVLRVPAHARVNVTCSGAGCPFSVKRGGAAGRTRTVNLTSLFGPASLAPAATFAVSVTKTNTLGRVWRFTVRRAAQPLLNPGCLQPGSLTARAGCRVP
jgi:hypothetical protein